MKSTSNWERYTRWQVEISSLGFSFDFSRMKFEASDLESLAPRLELAFNAMSELEKGAVANPDEGRMVGHYWLRAPELAPDQEKRRSIEEAVQATRNFAQSVHDGSCQGARGRFTNVLIIGIGGSALGPQFVSKALGLPSRDKMRLSFFDNTDPDGIELVLDSLAGKLGQTLAIVISKSGGTKETRNGLLEAKRAYEADGLIFSDHAVAVTGQGSQLDQVATNEGWIQRFPMWDWVGGRTSELSAVGLLPAALQGIDIDAFLEGARRMDIATRNSKLEENPAAMMAALWYISGEGRGEKNMVIVPYKDRLELFSKYLQQLVMESLGKDLNVRGEKVNQGISVFGNKGSTDQHAYIQQLRDGRNDFFATFIEVLRDRSGEDLMVEDSVTTGDFLFGFLVGTQEALTGSDRESMAITIPQVDPSTVGALIAVFERAVGLYASLIDINAYHQPGVEAGKKATGEVIDLQLRILSALKKAPEEGFSVIELVEVLGGNDSPEIVFRLCEHLAFNRGDSIRKKDGETSFSGKYYFLAP
jgi:glucose-6-phosphate isomerase